MRRVMRVAESDREGEVTRQIGVCRALPYTRQEPFENLLALLGANLPTAKFAKVLGTPKPFKTLMLLRFLGFLNPFCKKGLGGVQG